MYDTGPFGCGRVGVCANGSAAGGDGAACPGPLGKGRRLGPASLEALGMDCPSRSEDTGGFAFTAAFSGFGRES
jgi:hypothetical protein